MAPPVPTQAAQPWATPPTPEGGAEGGGLGGEEDGEDVEGEAGEAGEAGDEGGEGDEGDEGDEGGEGAEGGEGDDGPEWLPGSRSDGAARRRGSAAGGKAHAAATKASKVTPKKAKATKAARAASAAKVTATKFDVLITSYEVVREELVHLKKIEWRYMIVDEAHCLKKKDSQLAADLRALQPRHLHLLTGTPLQNNTSELWALCHVLDPAHFASLPAFLEQYGHGVRHSLPAARAPHP